MRGIGVQNARIFAIFFLFWADFYIPKNLLNISERLKLTVTSPGAAVHIDPAA